MTNINVQTLAAEAALSADPERVMQALAMDFLTGAVCTLKEIREMCIEMLETQREWLPHFAGKSVTAKAAVTIPADCIPVDVPLDPALAIGKRFDTLVTQGS